MTNLPSSASVFQVARGGLVLAAAALALAACSSNGSPPSSTGAGAESSPADAALGSFAGVTFHGSAQRALWLAGQRERVDKDEVETFRRIRQADYEACRRAGRDNC